MVNSNSSTMSFFNPGSLRNIFISFLLMLTISVPAFAATIQVTSDRNPVSLNESFQLVYESNESVDDDPDFSSLEKHLEILNRSQSSNVSIINGRYTSSKTWTLSVMAKQVGVIDLPAIKFGSDQSTGYSLTVTEAATSQLEQTGFYTRIRVDQEQVYAQQQFVITQQLFSDKNLSAYGLGELDFNGMDVVSQPLGEEKQYKTRIGDRAFLVIERSYAVFPQSSGLLTLKPVLAEARIGSVASSFFDSIGRSKVVRARSNGLDVAVLPVPKNINVNPWLPAKDLQFLEQWPQNPPKFVQGEPVTRTISIKAEGLTAAQLPVMPDISIDGLKQYPDQPLLNDIKNDVGITGYRVEKVALIPTRAGKITLPAIDIPWWNTETQKRELARIPARTIDVQASTAITPVQPSIVEQGKPQEIIELNEQPQEPLENLLDEEPATSKLWFVLALVFACGWFITVMAWFITFRKKNGVVSSEKNDTPVSVKKAFRQLKKACDSQDAAECRQQLLLWAQALFPGQDITNLTDLVKFLAAEMSIEIRKLDAVLYGNKDQQINYSIIIDQARQTINELKKHSARSKPQLLEPLYK